jgi:predicted RNA polymerase sigma factor
MVFVSSAALAAASRGPRRRSGWPAPLKIPERGQRLGAVLEAIDAAFSYGWPEAFSDDPRGCDLAEEPIWLVRGDTSP